MKISKKALRLLGHMKYLRFGIRDRIIRIFHNPDTAGAEEFEVPFFGLKYKGNLNVYLDWTVFYYGAYAREELRLIAEILETIPDAVSFDVGANVGHHTIFMSQYSKRVFAFEPFEAVSDKIIEKIKHNQIENIELCKFGLGENNSIEDYFPPSGSNSGTGSFISNDANSQPIRLEIKKGDDFVQEKGLNQLDFIKMDIEGFEPSALSGLRKTLDTYRPVAFFEWSQSSRNLHKAAHEYFPQDYVFYQFIPETLILKLFRHKSYQLRPTQKKWEDGNLLAVPKEYAERVKSLNPKPTIAGRFKDIRS